MRQNQITLEQKKELLAPISVEEAEEVLRSVRSISPDPDGSIIQLYQCFHVAFARISHATMFNQMVSQGKVLEFFNHGLLILITADDKIINMKY